MAKVIEFYVPKRIRQKTASGSRDRGKLIEFCSPVASVTDARSIQSSISEAYKTIAAFLVTSLEQHKAHARHRAGIEPHRKPFSAALSAAQSAFACGMARAMSSDGSDV